MSERAADVLDEVANGSRNTYELDEKTGRLRLPSARVPSRLAPR